MTVEEAKATLNDQQIAFCEHYVVSLNATQAAIDAGYSEKTARQQGSRLLTNVNIKAFTDFDDADIEPKAYFMKAIPQMCACVIIGIFIFFRRIIIYTINIVIVKAKKFKLL